LETQSTPGLRERLAEALGASYRIEREMSGGGMSRVFLAHDTRLDRRVVVKVLAPELAAGVSAERFEREIRVAARLQHPHVVPLLSAGEVGGLPYYTMPFIDGESLRARLVAHSAGLGISDAIRLLRELAYALEYAHAQGVMHRDLKPENVLLSGGRAMIADFGIAKALAAATQGDGSEESAMTPTLSGVAIGTPAYMAPEQAAADPSTDHRADLYALGMVAYELLAGVHPFVGRAPQALLAAHVTEVPSPLSARRPDAPTALTALVMRLIEKRPDDRPQSAEQVLRALDDIASPSGARDVAAPGATRFATRARPSRRWAAMLAVLAGVVLTALGVGTLVMRQRSAPTPTGPVKLAVLPFESQGPPELAYFADGLTDAISGKLAALSGLGVIDQRSVALYRNTNKPARQIGEELGVDYLLEGVVRWVPDVGGDVTKRRAQIVPQLVRAHDATTLSLGDPVVVTPADPFRAQTEVAAQVAEGLGVALAAGEKRLLAKQPTANTEAYDAFLRGQAFFNEHHRSSQPRDLALAEEQLARAVALDPRFALAWARLAFVHFTSCCATGAHAAGHEAREIAATVAAADSAVRLDPTLAEAWIARSQSQYTVGDQLGARASAERALRLAPSSADALLQFGAMQYILGATDSGRASIARAVRIAPRSLEVLNVAAKMTTSSGDLESSEVYADRILALDPAANRAHITKVADALYLQGDTVLAARRLDTAFRRMSAPSAELFYLMPYVRGAHLKRFASLSADTARAAGVKGDPAYLDAKADAYALLDRPDQVRVYRDSLRRMLTLADAVHPSSVRRMLNADVVHPAAFRRPLMLAAADAGLGRRAEALDLVHAVESAAASPASARWNASAESERAYRSAQVYALLGEADAAVVSLRHALALPGRYAAAYYRLDPKLAALRGNPAFERLVHQRH
jgi:serine/threonine-protein kinase